METHPPKLIEDVVGALIPPACREHVLGDLYERYASPAQYILDVLATLPLVIASQIRRTFRIQLFLAQACALYLAFGGASLAGGPAYLYDHAALLPLVIVIAVVLVVLVFCDVYADPHDVSGQSERLRVGLALTFAYFSQGVIGLINLEWILPIWILLAGTAASALMLLMVRSVFRKSRRDLSIPGGGIMSLDGIRRRSAEEYRKSWRVNWLWLIAALVVVAFEPGLWEAGSGVLLIVIIVLTAIRSKKGRIGTEDRFTSLSISRDPYRNQLELKRNGLLFWVGGGLFGLLPGAAPTLILFLITVPLCSFFVRWLASAPLPSNVSVTRVWLAFIAFVVLSVAWLFVRRMNLRAARAMREELEALESSDKKQ